MHASKEVMRLTDTYVLDIARPERRAALPDDRPGDRRGKVFRRERVTGMMVSTKGRYALRVMIDLAKQEEEGNVPLSEIARRQEISVKYLEAVMAILNRAGLVVSRPCRKERGLSPGQTSGAISGGRNPSFDRRPVGAGPLPGRRRSELQPVGGLRDTADVEGTGSFNFRIFGSLDLGRFDTRETLNGMRKDVKDSFRRDG